MQQLQSLRVQSPSSFSLHETIAAALRTAYEKGEAQQGVQWATMIVVQTDMDVTLVIDVSPFHKALLHT